MELTIYSGPQKYLILRFNDLDIELENLVIEANVSNDLEILEKEKFKHHLKEALSLIKNKQPDEITVTETQEPDH